MLVYTYKPLKVKSSTKVINVIDSNDKTVCSFKRKYNNIFTRIADILLGHDYFVQFNVFDVGGKIKYRGIKKPRWGRTQYEITNLDYQEKYLVSYLNWQTISPEFVVQSSSGYEFTVKKNIMDWARFYYGGKEVARWKMNVAELYKTYLEIEEDSPINEPEFFICLFQLTLYIGG